MSRKRDQKRSDAERVTFRLLDREQGNEQDCSGQYGIPGWLHRMYDIPLEAWKAEDLARACRQQLYMEALMPHCLRTLRLHPRKFGYYQPELLEAFLKVPEDYWREHPEHKIAFLHIAEEVLQHGLLDKGEEALEAQVKSYLPDKDHAQAKKKGRS